MDTEPMVRGVSWVIVTSHQELVDHITATLGAPLLVGVRFGDRCDDALHCFAVADIAHPHGH